MEREHRGLVPVTAIEQKPLLTSSQKDTLVRSGFRYLQDNGIQANPKSVEKAGEVVLDALSRGLKSQGKTSITEKEGVTRFIKIGFEERNAIRREAKAIIDESTVSNVGLRYIGPTALPLDLIDDVRGEANNFILTPDISKSEQLVSIENQRRDELDVLYELAISQLPEEVQANARRRELNRGEKAKLVRNLITSIVFRNTKNPIITIDQLWEFNKLHKESSRDLFTESYVEKIAEMDGYIQYLFEQTREIFTQSLSVSYDSKDQLFRNFDRGLLLLHPALEEEPISVNPSDAGKGERQTLWDRGYTTEIEGFLIPKKEILIAAIRQANAALLINRSRMLKEALDSWSRFEIAKQSFPKKVRDLSDSIDVQKKTIEDMKANLGTMTLPEEDLGYANNVVKEAEQEAVRKRSTIRNAKDTIAESRRSLRKIAIIRNKIEKARKTGKPIEIPTEIYIEFMGKKYTEFTRFATYLENRSVSMSERARQIIENYKDRALFSPEIEQILDLDNFTERQCLLQLEAEIKNLNEGVVANVFNLDNIDSVRQYVMSTLREITRHPAYRRTLDLQDLTGEDLKRLRNYLRHGMLTGEVLSIVSKAALQNIANELRPIVEGKRRARRLRYDAGRISETIKEYTADDWEVIQDSALDELEIEDLYRVAFIGAFPRTLKGKRLEEAEKFVEIVDIYSLQAILPVKVDKRKFRSAIKKYMKDGKLRYRETTQHSSDVCMDAASIFLELINTPILSLKKAKEMETEKYLDVLGRKRLLTARHFRMPQLEKDYEELTLRLEDLRAQREIVQNNLALKHLKEEYENLLFKTPERLLLSRMKRFGLALEKPQSKQT